MTTSIIPDRWVEALAPAPRPYNLIASAYGEDEVDLRWAGAPARVRPWPAGPASPWISSCMGGGSAPAAKPLASQPAVPTFMPIVAALGVVCAERGVDVDDITTRLLTTFTATEAYAAERAFWTGADASATATGGHSLAGGGAHIAQPNGTTATAMGRALQFLEGAIAATGSAGMIHAPVATVSGWSNTQSLVASPDGRLRTKLGTIVVAGSGYPGTSPTGVAPAAGSEWAYATGLVSYRRAPDIVTIPLEPSQAIRFGADDNMIAFYAEREYLISWDDVVHAGVLVNLTQS